MPGRRRYSTLFVGSACFGCSLLAPSDDELTARSASELAPEARLDAGKQPDAPSPPTPAPAPEPEPSPGPAPAPSPAPAPEAGVDAGPRCEAPVDCALAVCDGLACADFGQRCQARQCVCPGGSAPELDCRNGDDDDCDGLVDCDDPDCDTARCGASVNNRCCSGRCVDTESDPANCQGCGLACAPGQDCVRVLDDTGIRGACTCSATSQCPSNPAEICRQENDDNQNDLCACDAINTGNAGCAPGQVCQDVPFANFCQYLDVP